MSDTPDRLDSVDERQLAYLKKIESQAEIVLAATKGPPAADLVVIARVHLAWATRIATVARGLFHEGYRGDGEALMRPVLLANSDLEQFDPSPTTASPENLPILVRHSRTKTLLDNIMVRPASAPSPLLLYAAAVLGTVLCRVEKILGRTLSERWLDDLEGELARLREHHAEPTATPTHPPSRKEQLSATDERQLAYIKNLEARSETVLAETNAPAASGLVVVARMHLAWSARVTAMVRGLFHEGYRGDGVTLMTPLILAITDLERLRPPSTTGNLRLHIRHKQVSDRLTWRMVRSVDTAGVPLLYAATSLGLVLNRVEQILARAPSEEWIDEIEKELDLTMPAPTRVLQLNAGEVLGQLGYGIFQKHSSTLYLDVDDQKLLTVWADPTAAVPDTRESLSIENNPDRYILVPPLFGTREERLQAWDKISEAGSEQWVRDSELTLRLHVETCALRAGVRIEWKYGAMDELDDAPSEAKEGAS